MLGVKLAVKPVEVSWRLLGWAGSALTSPANAPGGWMQPPLSHLIATNHGEVTIRSNSSLITTDETISETDSNCYLTARSDSGLTRCLTTDCKYVEGVFINVINTENPNQQSGKLWSQGSSVWFLIYYTYLKLTYLCFLKSLFLISLCAQRHPANDQVAFCTLSPVKVPSEPKM